MRDLTQYRISISKERLEDAKTLLELGSFKGSINRSYYSIFSSVRALLAEEEVDFKKHSAVIGYFRQHYIKTGVFDSRFSKYVGEAFEIRNNCDYEDFFVVSKEAAEIQYNNAVEFYEEIKKFLESSDSCS